MLNCAILMSNFLREMKSVKNFGISFAKITSSTFISIQMKIIINYNKYKYNKPVSHTMKIVVFVFLLFTQIPFMRSSENPRLPEIQEYPFACGPIDRVGRAGRSVSVSYFEHLDTTANKLAAGIPGRSMRF